MPVPQTVTNSAPARLVSRLAAKIWRIFGTAGETVLPGAAQAGGDQRRAGGRLPGEGADGRARPGLAAAAADVAAAQLRLEQAIAAQQAKIADWERRTAGKIAVTGTGVP